MDRWEYLRVWGGGWLEPTYYRDRSGKKQRVTEQFDQFIDRLGSEGWDLVAVEGGYGTRILYFKRRIS